MEEIDDDVEVDTYKIEHEIINVLKNNRNGLGQSQLIDSINAKKEEVVNSLNDLIQQNRIVLVENQGEYVLKYQSAQEQAKFRDLSMEELNTYQLISSSGSSGISTNEIKTKTNFSTNLLNKIFKKLEKKLLIKSYKVINMKNKKVL